MQLIPYYITQPGNPQHISGFFIPLLTQELTLLHQVVSVTVW